MDSLETAGLYRARGVIERVSGCCVERGGRRLVSFASNDYLGLANDPPLASVALAATERFGWGATASPLVCGYTAAHQSLERTIAEFEGTEAALVFSSGYTANVGTIAALVGVGDAVFCDRLNHASIVDGCRLSGARLLVYPHRDAERLQKLLERHRGYRRKLIVSDSLFSMDGDLASLEPLADLADRYEAMLMLDEAHATGVFGRGGRGVAEQQGVEQRVPVRVGTLSKALGLMGGFVSGPKTLIEWLVNRARPYMFSTALPAACCAAAEAAVAVVQEDPQRRVALLDRAERFREQLQQPGFNVGPSQSQIIPILVGDSRKAMEFSAALEERGWLVPAIRPPSVPRGAARLRISLTAAHDDAVLDGLRTDLVLIARSLGCVSRDGA